jgi:hypothetical protein
VIFSRISKNLIEFDKNLDSSKMENSETLPNNAKKPKISVDSEGFILPANGRTTRKSSRKQQQSQQTPTQNGYSDLTDSDMSVDEVLSTTSSQNRSRTTTSPPQKAENKRPDTAWKPSVPRSSGKTAKPIMVNKTTLETIRTVLMTVKLSKSPLIQKRHGNDFSIFANSAADKKIIIEKLKTQMIHHFTFTENEDRHLLFVLLGHHEISTDNLLDELKINDIPAVKVSKINASTEDPVFLVSFEKNSTTFEKLLHQHNIVDGLRIRWKKYEPKNRRPSQCKRCQRYGHAANNCALPYRCMKCKEDHMPGKCSRTSRTDGLPSCINCGEEGHATNSTRCSIYQQHVEAINARKKPTQQRPRTFAPTRFDWSQQHVSTPDFNSSNFPTIASQSSPTSTNRPPIVNSNREYRPNLSQTQKHSITQNMSQDPFSQLRDLQNELSSLPDIKETLKLFAKFVEEIKSAKTQGERIAILIKYTGLSTQISSPQQCY